MAYYVNTSPTLEGIPQDIINFAINTLGWIEISPGVIAAPGADPGIGFFLSSRTNGATARYQRDVQVSVVKDGTSQGHIASAYVPYIGSGYVSPTRLHIFGGVSGAPYIGVAIEFTPGLYRHLYLGYMEKLGSYGGGEIVSGSYWNKNSTTSRSYTDTVHKYPFRGVTSFAPYTNVQGVLRAAHGELGGEAYLINHAAANSNVNTVPTVDSILGGFGDNIIETSLAVGTNPLVGSNLLVPINMFRVLPSSRYQPLGRPAGVRMINIADIDPAAPISVGGKTWRCFPVFKKGSTGSVGANYSDESSYIIGIAYLED